MMPTERTAVTEYTIGIRYEALDSLASMSDGSIINGKPINESVPRTKHWALVFTPRAVSEKCPAFRIELKRCPNDELEFKLTELTDPTHQSFALAQWTGSMEDIMALMDKHPMNTTNKNPYSAWYNNCQHWAATMLLMLKAPGQKEQERSLCISNAGRWGKATKILGTDGSSHRYHKVNPWFRGARVTGLVSGVTATAGLVSAAVANTVAITAAIELPAAGLAGLFGATVTESVVVGSGLTAAGTAAVIALPVVGAGVLVGGIVVAVTASEWKAKTRYRDPSS